MMIKTENLRRAAIETLRLNDSGGYTKPSIHLYPHQWNWDSAVIALGLSHFDLDAAKSEIRSLLSGQWKNGMVPHIIFHKNTPDYFPGPDFWNTGVSPDSADLPTSGITQPPLLASMVKKIHARYPMLDFVREVYPKLLAWHRWFHSERDADHSGLVSLIHPWESGTDDAPRWLSVLKEFTPVNVGEYKRVDNLKIKPEERPEQKDYDYFIYLINLLRQKKYSSMSMIDDSPFLVQDVLFNSILYQADVDLRTLALELGESTDEIDIWLKNMKANFQNRFWNEEEGLYYDYDLRNHRQIKINDVFTFSPLYASLCEERQLKRLIDEHWNNPKEYGIGEGLNYFVTTLSKSEPDWEANRYWRGPVWIIINWLIMQGFEKYGCENIVKELRQNIFSLITKSGFWEYYNAMDGSGCGATSFSWPAAITVELLSQ